jgi:predicted  nucleic acid-binding Zn-ribbon protein
MNETNRTIEVFLSQLDKRLTSFEQNLLEMRREMEHLRGEVAAQIRDVRGEIGQLREEMAAQMRDVRGEIGQVRGEIGQVRGEIGQVRGEIGQVRGEIGQVREAMERMRSDLYAEIRSTFRWTITTMVALFAIAVPVWTWFLSLVIKAR